MVHREIPATPVSISRRHRPGEKTRVTNSLRGTSAVPGAGRDFKVSNAQASLFLLLLIFSLFAVWFFFFHLHTQSTPYKMLKALGLGGSAKTATELSGSEALALRARILDDAIARKLISWAPGALLGRPVSGEGGGGRGNEHLLICYIFKDLNV